MSSQQSGRLRPLLLAGNPALDFLNTRMRVKEDIEDLLQSDKDVILWLKQAGFPAPALADRTTPLALLRSARKLRESVRSLVERRKSGRRGDTYILNRFLAANRSYPQLVWRKSAAPAIEMVRRQEMVGSILAPVAEVAASLLSTPDFELIKHCEDDTCTLWFLDQTKSHNRRWCSMEICGNRRKVAAYRVRDRNRRYPIS